MPSILVYTNILGQPSFEKVSIAHSFKLSLEELNLLGLQSPYLSVGVSVGCWNPEKGLGSTCPCTLSWHQSLVQNTVDQFQWNPSYQCNVCSCQCTCACCYRLEQLYSSVWIAPQRTDAVWVNISMDPTWATNLGVYDNTQLILFDPNSQALGHIDSYLNATGEPSERAILTPFSLYYNFNSLLRYTVEYSRHRALKRSWHDVIGLPGVREILLGHLIAIN